MVAKNPNSGRAYLNRFRYNAQFHPPSKPAQLAGMKNDLKKALELSPEDVEVLLSAARAADQDKDPASARRFFEKALEIDKKNAIIAIQLADLELRQGHPNRAEEILRQAYKEKATIYTALFLASLLIDQGKLERKGTEGEDQADTYIAQLRSWGFGESYVRFLEAKSKMRFKQWSDASKDIEAAQLVLKSDPRPIEQMLDDQLDLMLAECRREMGNDEQTLAVLQRAVDTGGASVDQARIQLAQASIKAGISTTAFSCSSRWPTGTLNFRSISSACFSRRL
jgi:tetratricopeptide (TPR) repeat protein